MDSSTFEGGSSSSGRCRFGRSVDVCSLRSSLAVTKKKPRKPSLQKTGSKKFKATEAVKAEERVNFFCHMMDRLEMQILLGFAFASPPCDFLITWLAYYVLRFEFSSK